MNAKLYTYNNKVSVHNYIVMYLQQLLMHKKYLATKFCFNLQ